MKKLFTFLLLAFSLTALAQEKIPVKDSDYANNSVEMADLMRSEGKIYVLVGIIVIVFVGIIVYLISTDRKISQIEKNLPQIK
jgi:CcmD family protein